MKRALALKILRPKSSTVCKPQALSCFSNRVVRQREFVFRFERSIFLSKTSFSVVPYKLSDIGEGIKEVVIKEWFVREGDTVNQFDQICEVQSDKASVTITSRYDGVVTKLYYEVDDTAQVGFPLIDIEVAEDDDSSASVDSIVETVQVPSDDFPSDTKISEENNGKVLATPVVRRIASEMNIDISKVSGSGPKGRILKENLLAFSGEPDESLPIITPQDTTTVSPSFASNFKPEPVSSTHDTVVKLTPYQKGMHKAMTSSLQIPHFTYSDEVNMNELVAMKGQLKKLGKSLGVKLTLMPFMIKAASLALLQYPQLNAHYLPEEEVVLLKGSHNIGIAVDTQQGLLVPNIKNCEHKSVVQIAQDLNELQKAGNDDNGKVSFQQSQLSGGTFSLSNIGFLGGTYTKPVIAPPEVAIGAMGRISVLPRFEPSTSGSQYEVIPTNVMNISWSADHRVLDGATVCRFSNLWKSYLENPKLMLLHLK
ncbi:lipoamide acyltransferase component of branched-chain alpha-keto acid dehydrogenase complex, mitochondrial-like [Convolutriloba macropyga]|uniref:lipoamide acyltransferase component of branched-chain alpha-keto acid dehydrogenase complex, mitochondrial-like n=1 Tax=Convolutriloba macropyga TaxID=536237 RepID=UPI003F527B52